MAEIQFQTVNFLSQLHNSDLANKNWCGAEILWHFLAQKSCCRARLSHYCWWSIAGPSDRSYSQFWRSSHIKILLLYEKFYLRHKKSKWLNFHNYSIKKTRKPTKVSGSFYWYFMMWKMLAGVWYERGNNIEDNAIGCHSLVSMIRLLTPSSPSSLHSLHTPLTPHS